MRRFNLGKLLVSRFGPASNPDPPRAVRRSRRASLLVEAFEERTLLSITIAIDYTYDTNRFFDTQAKRDLLQLAANSIASSLNDTLLGITPSGSNTWTAIFPNPSNVQSTLTLNNPVIPANTVVIYAGGSRLGGLSEAGEGSTGGFNGIGDANWLNNILSSRGKAGALANPATAFGPWGGSISFDNSGGTNWFFGTTTAGLTGSQTDFLSVAEHEIGHVLGIGTAESWTTYVSGSNFVGPASVAAHGGQPVPLNAGRDHWANGTTSGGSPAAMDPVLTNGTRAVFTALDFAGLKDVGWRTSVTPANPQVQLGSAAYSAFEDAGSVSVTVTRSAGSGAFSVQYATSNGTGLAGVDYVAASGTLSFAAGETSKTFLITLLNNSAVQANRTVNVSLSSPTGGATLGSPASAVLTIQNVAGPSKTLGDFDGDGRTDVGVFRPKLAQWVINRSSSGLLTPLPTFGAVNYSDVPVIGDFDGIGRAQIGVFRRSTAQWFVLGPNGSRLIGTFGAPNLFDIPVPGDYDGVGRTELAVFRPSTAQWFVLGPTGSRLIGTFGAPNLIDIPVPGDWFGTGKAVPAVFRPSTAQWFAMSPTGGKLIATFGGANLLDIPVPGVYDGGGKFQPAVFRPSTSQWFGLGQGGSFLITKYGLPNYQELPIEAPFGSLIRLGLNANGGKPVARKLPQAAARGVAASAAVSTRAADTPAAAPAKTARPRNALAVTPFAARRKLVTAFASGEPRRPGGILSSSI